VPSSGHSFDLATVSERSAEALEHVGTPAADARLTARSLVVADQRGIYSHGLLRLPLYVSAIQKGGIKPRPNLRWHREHEAVAVLDADCGLGQVAMQAAVDRVKERATRFGIAAVTVQNSSHYGAGAFWSDQLVAAGMIAFITSTTGPTVAPFGGTQSVLGTNPLTLALPSSGPSPLTADLATSAGAYGKVLAARNEGQQIPDGWAIDQDGQPTNDPAAAISGSLLAFGGHKGSAISVLLEAFAATLGTSYFAHQTEDIWSNPSSRMNTGHFIIGIDTSCFTNRKHTEDRVAELQEAVRSARADGERILAPGDIEYGSHAVNSTRMTLSNSTVVQLNALFAACGLDELAPLA
jgi:LDH2 family malate/lactate/ureidoglycolate dehydrogenase